MSSDSPISLKAAREVLGVSARATPGELRRAFRDAAKQAHPDRPGGGAERFRQVVEAYHRLQALHAGGERIIQPPVPRPADSGVLEIGVLMALRGGLAERTLGGKRVRIRLPAGLRAGDTVRTAGGELRVAIRGTPEILVRGDDLWVTVPVMPRVLNEGGRVALETPLGRHIVWLTPKACERKLVRLVGQGLPARGSHRHGHLFLRLAPTAGEAHSAARTLLRRFAAAWAA